MAEQRFFFCSGTARTELRILAFIDAIVGIITLVLVCLLTYAIINHPKELEEFVQEHPGEQEDLSKLLAYGRLKQGIFLTVLILKPMVTFLLAILFIVGAQKRNYTLIRTCMMITVFYIVIDMVLFIPKTVYTQMGKAYVIVYCLNLIYMVYEFRVIYLLNTELRELWEAKQADEESEPEPRTDDATVVEADADAEEAPE